MSATTHRPRDSAEPFQATEGAGPFDAASWSAVVPYLPAALVDALERHPDRAPVWIDPLEGSLVFADISGFTRMSERLAELGKEGAERLTGIINQYFSLMLDIARNRGGGNLKFGGDALLLLFTGDNHASHAVSAALAMIRATRESPTIRVGRDRIRLSMKAGVHSGTFWAASAGIPGVRLQHFLLGQEVSRVAETEEEAMTGEVHITGDTMGLVSELCTVEPRSNTYRVLRLSRRAVTHVVPWKSEAPVALHGQDLLAYLPPPIIQTLKSAGQAEILEGEHRKVSVMFINVLETEEVLQEHGPEVLLNEIQQYVSTVVELAGRYGGFLVSNDIYTHGLKLILVFGAPVAHEQDSANAFRLALELTSKLPQLNVHLRHRIGINSGFVFAGDVGGVYRREYTVMGDAVNLSARLMSAAGPGQVLASRQIFLEAGPSFVASELEPIRVKGKQRPIPICALEGERALDVAKVTGQEGPLLSRETEMSLLRHLCDEAEGKEGRSVVIWGEAGMGKSRLLQEFEGYLSTRGWTLHRGRCQPHTMASPFAPWVQVLQSFFGMAPGEPTEDRTEKTLATIERLRPDLLEMAPLLNGLLQLSVPLTDVFLSLDMETRRHKLFELVTALFQAVAVESPQAIVVEDLHWGDRSSLELAGHVGASLGFSRLLLCFTARPKEGLELGLPPNTNLTISLRELTRDAGLQLVSRVLDWRELPTTVAEAIFAKAGGNPLFLEEVARSISQSHALDQMLASPSLRFAEGMAALEVPDRVQGLIMSRIDALDSMAKTVLRAAAVIGHTFDMPTLQPLLQGETEAIFARSRLQQLVQLGFITVEEGLKPSYRFKHALTQEIAYDSLTFARRRDLHHRVASYMENAHQGQLDPFYESLLYHYMHSGDHPNTLVYAVRSADKASRVFAHGEAIQYFECGLTALREMGGQVASHRSYLMERIGDCHEAAGYHEQAAGALFQALRAWRSATRHSAVPPAVIPELGDGLPPKVRLAVLSRKIGVSYERNSEYDSSLKWLESASKALPSGQPLQAGLISVAKGVSLFRKGRYQEAIQWGREGLRLTRRRENSLQLAYAHNMLANSFVELGKLREALRHRSIAVRLYDEAGDVNGQAVGNNNLGSCYQVLGDLQSALRHYELSLGACERIGNPMRAAIVHNNIGEVLLIQGHLEQAVEHLEKVVETYERMGDPIAVTGLALVNLSRARQYQRLFGPAQECLERGIELLRKVGARGLLTEAQLQQADLAREMGRGEAASRICQRALSEARESGMKVMEARGLRILARLSLSRGRHDEAEANLRQSVNIAASHGADYERGLAFFSLAELYSVPAEKRDARQRWALPLRRAISTFQRLGAERDLQEALQMQASLGLPKQ